MLNKIQTKLGKRGQADFVSLFFVLVVLFGSAIFFVVLYNAYSENIRPSLNDALTSSTPVDENANITKILGQTSEGVEKFNPLFPLLLVGLFAFGLIVAYMGKSHPVFFFVGLIMLAVSIILAVIFSNVHESITTHDNFSSAAETFNIMDLVMSNLPLTIFILFICISAILYGFRGGGTPQGGSY